MKISAFCSITRPEARQDPWRESLLSVLDFADEVVVVYGDAGDHFLLDDFKKKVPGGDKIKAYFMPWPDDFNWEELPRHLNLGLKQCTGDWAVRFDIDYIFEEATRSKLNMELPMLSDKKGATMQKFSSVLAWQWYQKGGSLLAINLKYKDEIYIGKDPSQETDLCFPVVNATQNKFENDVPIGRSLTPAEIGTTHVELFNYDYTFKTKEFTQKEFYRFSMAHKKHYGTTGWGQTEEESLAKFIEMMKGRQPKCVYKKSIGDHPKYIVAKVADLTSSQFGYNGWGLLK